MKKFISRQGNKNEEQYTLHQTAEYLHADIKKAALKNREQKLILRKPHKQTLTEKRYCDILISIKYQRNQLTEEEIGSFALFRGKSLW